MVVKEEDCNANSVPHLNGKGHNSLAFHPANGEQSLGPTPLLQYWRFFYSLLPNDFLSVCIVCSRIKVNSINGDMVRTFNYFLSSYVLQCLGMYFKKFSIFHPRASLFFFCFFVWGVLVF